MLTRKHRLLSLLLAVILVCSQLPSAAVQAPEAPPPPPDTVPAPFSDRLQAEDLSGALPRGIAPEVPLNAEGWLDLPSTLANSAPLRQPANLESCFGYQQLKDPTLQTIYKAMYTAITEAEEGRAMPFQFNFDTPARFGWDEMQRVWNLYLLDQPLDGWVMGYLGGMPNADWQEPGGTFQLRGHREGLDKAKFDREFQKLLSAADGLTSDYEKALALHDALALHNTYDHDAYERHETDATHPTFHAYGAIAEGLSVCDGYARAYQALLNAAGIPAFRVLGMDHAWNMVVLDGKYYYTDVTWDDMDHVFHTYFNLPYSRIIEDHLEYQDQGYQLPAQANPNDMSMLYRNMVFTEDYASAQQDMIAKVQSYPDRHQKITELYYTGNNPHNDQQSFNLWCQSRGPQEVWTAVCGQYPWETSEMKLLSFHRGHMLLFTENPARLELVIPEKIPVPTAAPGQENWITVPCSVIREYDNGDKLTTPAESLSIKSAQGHEGLAVSHGDLKISNRAKPGFYDLTAGVAGVEVQRRVEITRAAPVAAAAALTGGVDQMVVPAPGRDPSVSKEPFVLVVYDQYGLPMAVPDEHITWTVEPAEGAAFDPATGLLTLTDKAPVGQIVLTATVNHNGKTAAAFRKLDTLEDTSTVAQITLTGRTEEITILPDGNVQEVYTLTALDQNGNPALLDLSQLNWSTVPAPYGVRLEPSSGKAEAVLTVTPDAENTDLTIQAQYGGQTARLSVALRRQPSVLTQVHIYQNDIFNGVTHPQITLTQGGPVENVFYAETNDQYGIQMQMEALWKFFRPDGTEDNSFLSPVEPEDPAYKEDYCAVRLTLPANTPGGEYELSLQQTGTETRFALPLTVVASEMPNVIMEDVTVSYGTSFMPIINTNGYEGPLNLSYKGVDNDYHSTKRPVNVGHYTISVLGENDVLLTTADLVITPCKITLRAKNQTIKAGEPIPAGPEQLVLAEGRMARGDRVTSVTLTGDNRKGGVLTPSDAVIFNGTQDRTSNYIITYLPGTLTVLPADPADPDSIGTIEQVDARGVLVRVTRADLVGCTLVVAGYDRNGQMTALASTELSTTGLISLSGSGFDRAHSVKVMAVDQNFTPVAPPLER